MRRFQSKGLASWFFKLENERHEPFPFGNESLAEAVVKRPPSQEGRFAETDNGASFHPRGKGQAKALEAEIRDSWDTRKRIPPGRDALPRVPLFSRTAFEVPLVPFFDDEWLDDP